MLLLVLYLVVRSIMVLKKNNAALQKNVSLLSSIGLFTLVWGMLGQLIGLVSAFDQIESLGEISTVMLAGGLKISALPTIFGAIVFVTSRVAIILFTWFQNEEYFHKE